MLLSSSRHSEFGGDLVFARERAQFFPRGVLDLDAVLAPLLLAQIFDFAGIEHALRALRRRRRFQIAREVGDFLLEVLQRAESGDVEYRHENPVIMPAGRLDAEAKAGEQAA